MSGSPKPFAAMTRGVVGRAAFTVAVFGLFLYIAEPFLVPVMAGAVGAVLFWNVQRWLLKKGYNPRLVAGFLTVIMAVGVVLPAVLVSAAGVRAGLTQLQSLQKLQAEAGSAGYLSLADRVLDLPTVRRILAFLKDWFSVEPDDVIQAMQSFFGTLGLKAADILGEVLATVPRGVGWAAVSLMSGYFFLVDGRRLVTFLRTHSFFEADHTERLIRSFGTMCRSVVLATTVSGGAQSLVFTLASALTGTPNLALVALGVFIFSFVPLVGCLPVTAGVVIYHAINGHTGRAAFLGVLAVVVSVLDNIIRPWILKGAGNLHPLLAFVAVFGGVKVLGIAGVFLGPILAGLFIVTLRIFLEPEPIPGGPETKAY